MNPEARAQQEVALAAVETELRTKGASEEDIRGILANLRARGRAGSAAVYAARKNLKTSRVERFGVGIEGDDAAETRRKPRNIRKRARNA